MKTKISNATSILDEVIMQLLKKCDDGCYTDKGCSECKTGIAIKKLNDAIIIIEGI